jgi:hypothetical protein
MGDQNQGMDSLYNARCIRSHGRKDWQTSDLHATGLSTVFFIDLGDSLTAICNLLYDLTRSHLVDHETTLPIQEKLSLCFKETPPQNLWSAVMSEVNGSAAFLSVVHHPAIKRVFQQVFRAMPEIHPITIFRARLPGQQRAVYTWHQDMGTWYLSKNKSLINCPLYTLWLSINGADESNSLQFLLSSPPINRLFYHERVVGQGLFQARIPTSIEINDTSIVSIKAAASEGIIFSPFLLHRSAPETKNLQPRYSIDIRYFNPAERQLFNTDLFFKIKRFFI